MMKHLFIALGIVIVLTVFMVYPYFPGPYDPLALPVSIIVQAFGIFGLLLTGAGLLWRILPKKEYFFASLALYICTVLIMIMACIAFFSSGKILCAFVIAIWLIAFFRLRKELRISKRSLLNLPSFIPIYLIFIPVLILAMQLLLAKPLTQWSRNKAMENAEAYINDLAAFKSTNGSYPKGVEALHKDYLPQITGIDQYHYLRYGDSYNLSFEQPRFLLDIIGTREVVVYNPSDDHRAYSHASWFMILSPEALEMRQGWYASESLEKQHWKYFLFD